MTLTELLSSIRRTLDDSSGTEAEYLWKSSEITDYLNEGVEQMCRVIPSLIRDNTSPSVCSLSLSAGTNSYTLDSSILDVTRVKLSTIGTPLTKSTTNWLDERLVDWDNTSNTAVPNYYVLDYTPGKITFCYTPDASYTASMTVHRLPLSSEKLSTSNLGGSPIISSAYHYNLIYWALHRCYGKNDSEAFNEQASKKYEERFRETLTQAYNMEFRKRGDINIYPHRGMI